MATQNAVASAKHETAKIVARWASDLFQCPDLEPQFDTLADALKARDMNWGVSLAPAFAQVNGKFVPIPETFATVRDDNGQPIAPVGKDYTAVSAAQSLAPVDSILKRGFGLLDVATMNDNRQVVALLARKPVVLSKRDILLPVSILRGSFDGTVCAIDYLGGLLRFACANGVMIYNGKVQAKRKHTEQVFHDMPYLERKIKESAKGIDEALILFTKMSEKSLTNDEARKLVSRIVPYDKGKTQKSWTQTDNVRDSILANYLHAPNLENVRGNVWGLYNAVCQYSDHAGRTRTVLRDSGSVSRQGDDRHLAELAFKRTFEGTPIKSAAYAICAKVSA